MFLLVIDCYFLLMDWLLQFIWDFLQLFFDFVNDFSVFLSNC